MKTIIKILMTLQFLLLLFGCYQLSTDEFWIGFFNITINLIGLTINMSTLKKSNQ
jgi:hypothetical protein